jgi:flagellar protein FlbD
MIKLTRLNQHVIAINPDHIQSAEATPDTCLSLLGGEKVLVRETLEEVIAAMLARRRAIRAGEHLERPSLADGDPPRISQLPVRTSGYPRPSGFPRRGDR